MRYQKEGLCEVVEGLCAILGWKVEEDIRIRLTELWNAGKKLDVSFNRHSAGNRQMQIDLTQLQKYQKNVSYIDKQHVYLQKLTLSINSQSPFFKALTSMLSVHSKAPPPAPGFMFDTVIDRWDRRSRISDSLSVNERKPVLQIFAWGGKKIVNSIYMPQAY